MPADTYAVGTTNLKAGSGIKILTCERCRKQLQKLLRADQLQASGYLIAGMKEAGCKIFAISRAVSASVSVIIPILQMEGSEVRQQLA